MPDIQVDMYEVQLGAAVMLQFDHDNEAVRVLADAGIHAGSYPRDHVLKKLKPSFQSFGIAGDDRIDLLMGTHYDKDHLDGLIDVAADTTLDITEAWLPPVEDDTDEDAGDEDSPGISLGAKFASEDGEAVFEKYIETQRQICEESVEIRDQLQEIWPPADRANVFRSMEETAVRKWAHTTDRDAVENFFAAQVRAADADLPESNGTRQADDDVDEFEELEMIEEFRRSMRGPANERPPTISEVGNLADRISNDRNLANNLLLRAAVVRKSAARNAINATSLKKLVDELNARNIPIRFEQMIQGQPKYYVLNGAGQFREETKATYDSASDPKLTLLGPSDALIKKHKKILPIFKSTMAMMVTIPIKSITPSNQLSYVAKFEHSDQSILISGDTGFVDFKPPGNKPYFQPMLDALDTIDVVQIAHHAGNNAHFYRVLQQSPFGSHSGSTPFFLLSHAMHDNFRPSAVFDSFVANLVAAGPIPELLFTSEPQANKVQNFVNLIAPVVGTQSTVGDVRLTFNCPNWSLDAHSVKV